MLNIKLPKELEIEYYEIKKEFEKIQNHWEKYNDQIIPQDNKFAKRIIKFIISIIDFVIDNYDSLIIEDYQDFLAYYNYQFLYGPNHDDSNYLDFDENFDGEPISEFCFDLKDENFKLTKEKLKEIKQKYLKVIDCFL
jgi:hypothetical protein